MHHSWRRPAPRRRVLKNGGVLWFRSSYGCRCSGDVQQPRLSRSARGVAAQDVCATLRTKKARCSFGKDLVSMDGGSRQIRRKQTTVLTRLRSGGRGGKSCVACANVCCLSCHNHESRVPDMIAPAKSAFARKSGSVQIPRRTPHQLIKHRRDLRVTPLAAPANRIDAAVGGWRQRLHAEASAKISKR